MAKLSKILTALVVGFGAFFVNMSTALAEAAEATSSIAPEVKGWIAIAAGFGMGIASLGGALGQAKAISSAMEGIARNPECQSKLFTPFIVGLVLIESLVIYTLVITFLLWLKI
jgi:F-type H+-transporting ATPase subunit c